MPIATVNTLPDIFEEITRFCQTNDASKPLLIGVTGGVSAGKSTLSKKIKEWYSVIHPHLTVSVIPTDNFIYPNAYLIEKNLMQKKGFPESFNAKILLEFLENIRNDRLTEYETPLYSHDLKDIEPENQMHIKKSDVYIIDGISVVFKFKKNNHEFFTPAERLDFCIYLDIDLNIAKKRAIDRFYQAFEKSKATPNPYFESMMGYSEKKVREYGEKLWNTIDVPLIKNYIKPQKNLAQLIVTSF